MKKILIMFVLVFAFTLAGCKGTKQPKITVEESQVTINTGEAITLLDGVKGFDHKSKDATDQIKVDQGLFSPYIKGEYEINFILDIEGYDSVTATKTVRVNDPLDALASAEVSNPDQVVLSYEGLSFTNAQLYRQLLPVVGLQVIMDIVNAQLLESYEVDLTDEVINQDIAKYKKGLTDEEWISFMAQFGVIPNDAGELNADDVKAFFQLGVLQRIASEKKAYDAITDEEITKAKEAYVADACVINLTYSTEEDAKTALETITAGDVLEGFKTSYQELYGELNVIEDNYLAKQLNCGYERVIHSLTAPATYRKLVFEDLGIDAYTTEVVEFNDEFHIVYKLGEAPDKSTYDEEEFTLGIKDLIVKQKVSNAYISQTMTELRDDLAIEFYDAHLYKQYNGTSDNYVAPTDPSVLVKFGDKTITADTVYQILKERYAHRFIMDWVYTENVLSYDGMELTKIMKDQVDQMILQYRKSYLQNQLQSQISFDYFIYYYSQGGFINEDHFRTYLNFNQLIKDYLLGNGQFVGENPIKDEEVEELNWFEVSASHILYLSDRDQDGEVTEEEEIEAKALAETAIKNLLKADNLETYFAELAKTESEDPGSKANGGALGYFGPNVFRSGRAVRMVEPFEEATLATAIGDITLTPVKTSYGYHIIYVTDKKEVPQKPVGYDDLTEKEIQEMPVDSEAYSYYAYQEWVESQLFSTRYNENTVNGIMEAIAKKSDITFNDPALHRQFQILYRVK